MQFSRRFIVPLHQLCMRPRKIMIRSFSSGGGGAGSNDSGIVGQSKKWNLVYEGPFTGMLRRLRRISIGTSAMSLIGFPLTFVFGIPNSSVSAAGQVAIVGTVLISSLSSTAFLHLVTNPYVTKLQEEVENNSDTTSEADRRFKATKLNLLGNEIENQFYLSEVTKPTSRLAAYTSCCANNENMYIHGKELMKDESLRETLTTT
jgi:hypothetical protein